MSTSAVCPGLPTLREYAVGGLRPPDRAALREHLGTCERCRGVLEGLEATRKASLPGEAGWTETEIDPTVTVDTRGGAASAACGDAPLADDETELLEDHELDFLLPSPTPGSIGRIAGYEVLGLLGRGGMGLVFRAFDPSLSRIVAVKVLSPRLASSARARKRFVREARSAAAINHPNVVTIHAVGEQKGLPYLVMECIAGQSLRQRIRSGPPLKSAQLLRISLQVAQGLDAAHQQVVIHRDIKPANIMLEDNVERVKLTDFGLAMAALSASELTSTEHLVGTPEYMSPEQVRGETLDPRSDLFGLGCVIYALVAGHSPFKGGHALDSLRRVTDLDPPPLSAVDPNVPPALSALVERLLSKDPDDRPRSAAEVADALRAILAADPLLHNDSAPSLDAVEPAALRPVVGTWGRRSRPRRLDVWPWIALTLGLLTLTLLAVNVRRWLAGEPPPPHRPPRPEANAPARPGPLPPPTGRPVLTVASDGAGDYRTVSQAVAAVERPYTAIRILDGGTYEGRIEVKAYPHYVGLVIEAVSPGERPTLQAPGARNEVVKIVNAHYVRLRGVTVASSADQFGLVLEGDVEGVAVEDVRFTKRPEPREQSWSHVWVGGGAHGTQRAPFTFDRCSFSPWMAGLVLQGNAGGRIAHGVIANSRFEVRTRQLELIAAVEDIRIEHNLFLNGATAIVLDNLGRDAGGVGIFNNTFLHSGKWIDPTGSLGEWSSLSIERNAILGVDRLDDDRGTLARGAEFGWTFAGNLWESHDDRPNPIAAPRPALAVESRDPADPGFLRPTPDSALLGPDGTYAGALPPGRAAARKAGSD